MYSNIQQIFRLFFLSLSLQGQKSNQADQLPNELSVCSTVPALMSL